MTDRRTLLKSALALVAAPFARFARAEVPTVAITAPLYFKGVIEATYKLPLFGRDHLGMLLRGMDGVNSVPVTLAIGEPHNRVTFAPGTLTLGWLTLDSGENPTEFTAKYRFHTGGLNRVLVPGQGYRDITPPPYAASDFAGFRETHEGLVWQLVRK